MTEREGTKEFHLLGEFLDFSFLLEEMRRYKEHEQEPGSEVHGTSLTFKSMSRYGARDTLQVQRHLLEKFCMPYQ